MLIHQVQSRKKNRQIWESGTSFWFPAPPLRSLMGFNRMQVTKDSFFHAIPMELTSYLMSIKLCTYNRIMNVYLPEVIMVIYNYFPVFQFIDMFTFESQCIMSDMFIRKGFMGMVIVIFIYLLSLWQIIFLTWQIFVYGSSFFFQHDIHFFS